ncbi:C2H2-type zinc finger protein [Candidatus Sororendozoicomonas aggregata]|uniref:C2H2-type zinc finger protein n=1 Tax=Candidatus Sororendozoicomonas aggregata TaxID=3073239 RepID=UPI003B75B5A9
MPKTKPKASTYTCLFCQATFEYRGPLALHISTHLGADGFACPICKKVFKRYDGLEKHFIIHSGAKDHPCEYCDKIFGRKDKLAHHTRVVHYNIRPHKCMTCDKGFAEPRALRAHMRTHTGLKPYKCSKCGVLFSSASSHDAHVKYRCKYGSYTESYVEALPDGNVVTSTAHRLAISPTLVANVARITTSDAVATITEHEHLGVGAIVKSVRQEKVGQNDGVTQSQGGAPEGNQSGLPNDNNLTVSVFYGMDFAASCPLDEIPEIIG